jgi:hypothetical protein
MNALAPLLERMRAATPRERAGLALIAALAALALASTTFDWAVNVDAAAQDAARARAELTAVHDRIGDEALQQEAALAAGNVWRWSVVDGSENLAQAQAASALEALALGAGLSNVSVSPGSEAPAAAEGPVTAIVLSLRADFSWGSYLALLRALEASELSFGVDAVQVESGGEVAPVLSMSVRAPFIQDAPPS